VTPRALVGGSTPKPPEFSALAADAAVAEEEDRGCPAATRSPGVQPTGGRSGRTPAEPYPPDGTEAHSSKPRKSPGKDHPWRQYPKPKP
jgi:hypothetical protein